MVFKFSPIGGPTEGRGPAGTVPCRPGLARLYKEDEE